MARSGTPPLSNNSPTTLRLKYRRLRFALNKEGAANLKFNRPVRVERERAREVLAEACSADNQLTNSNFSGEQVALGVGLEDKMPSHKYYEYFGPDYTLHVAPSNMENKNMWQQLDEILRSDQSF
ncbi:putative histone deacetylase 19 [Carex littledalei]|uniref:Putative histone deacetylase 19 n=1 Tax=Carex littledalei TaxID=544730 RepID=A0A833RJS9_9POAL|nr:putative histone deacetylase 19 [Carex littledalei]